VNFERGLNTPETNKKFDGLIKDALFVLSTAWGDGTGSLTGPLLSSIPLGTSIPSSVLHVVEYLVQKYFVHFHNAEALLVAFLPHHETILFERILQLIDLTQLPHWSFLRPYSGATGVRGVPRTLIAKWAASTVDNGGGTVLLTALCDLARRAARTHSQEKSLSSSSTAPIVIRRGTSLILSFAAAALAEALHIQNSTCGTIVEPTVRCLIPFILGAVEPRRKWRKELTTTESSAAVVWSLGAECAEWRSFGYIVISIVMKTCELSANVCEALATGIVKGSIEVDAMLRRSVAGKGVSGAPSLTAMESAGDSLLALMSVISNCTAKGIHTVKGDKTSRSPLSLVLTPDHKMDCSLFGSANEALGCGLSLSTFHILTSLDILPTALGYLSEEKHIDVRPLLASLIIMCVSVIGDDKTVKRKSRNAELCMKLAIHLIEESTLKSAWLEKDYSLSMSTSVFFVKAFSHCGRLSNDSACLKRFAKLLRSIRDTDSVGCDSGVGYAVTAVSSAADSTTMRVATVENLQMLLKRSGHLTGDVGALQSGVSDSSTTGALVVSGNEDALMSGSTAFDHILPSRVALEHPTEVIRMEAIQRLMKEVKDMSGAERCDVAISLFRRYVSDDVASVAAAAANAVQSMLSSGIVSEDFYLQPSVAEDAVIGVHKWSVSRHVVIHNNSMTSATRHNQEKNDKKGERAQGNPLQGRSALPKDAVCAVCASIRLSGLLAQNMTEQLLRGDQFDSMTDEERNDTIPDGLSLLVQELVLHFGISNITNKEGKVISETALCSLLTAVGEDFKENDDKKGRLMVWNNNVFLGIVSMVIRDISSAPLAPRSEVQKYEEEIIAKKAFMHIFLNNLAMDNPDKLHDSSISIQCSGALALVGGFSKNTKSSDSYLEDASKLLKCLEKCAAYLVEEGDMEKIIQFIIDLFSVPSQIGYEEISLPIIEVIGKAKQGEMSTGKFLLLLLEICSRPRSNTVVVERILKHTEKGLPVVEVQPNNEIIQCALITALGLLVHSELNVREGALKILNKIEPYTKKKGPLKVIGYLCSLVCEPNSPFRASLLLDGASALPSLLHKAVQGSDNASLLCDTLLRSCVMSVAAVQHFAPSTQNFFGIGFCNSNTLVLSAMESAGESSFPLRKRWYIAGKVFFDIFLQHSRTAPLPFPSQKLVECVVVMLKGVTVECNTSKHVTITTGPSGSGRRLRSYSFGKSDGISYIESYQGSMVNVIKKCLSIKDQHSDELCESLNRLVLSRPSWLNGIFPKLESSTRKAIAESLLKLRTESSMESAGVAFSGLTLDAAELCYLLSSITHQASYDDSGGLVGLSLLADFVRGRAKSLAHDQSILDLSSNIFDRVSLLSKDGNDGSEYTRSCLLHALCSLHDQNKITDIEETSPNKQRKKQKYSKQVGEHAKHIVSLLGAGDDGIAPLQSSKSRLICLNLLSHLCSSFPATVVHCLLPTIANAMSTLLTPIPNDVQLIWKTKAAEETLMVIIPAYCNHAPAAGLTLFSLLSAFLGTCDLGEKADFSTHIRLMGRLIDALISSSNPSDGGVAAASVLVYFIAHISSSCLKVATLSTTNTFSSRNILPFTSKLLVQVNMSHQITIALRIVQYTNNMLSLVCNGVPLAKSSDEEHNKFLAVSASDLSYLATRGKNYVNKKNHEAFNENEKTSLIWLSKILLEIVRNNILSTPKIKQAIRSCDNKQAEICLRIWQALMVVQSNSSQLRFGLLSASKTQNVSHCAFFDTIESETSASITLIQKLLPVPHFLASVSSIINEKETDHDLQKKAVILLAERSTETDVMSAEGVLFLGIVPDLVKLVYKRPEKDNESETRRVVALQEASCRALDQLARSLGLVRDTKIMQRRAPLFLPALRAVTHFLHSVSDSVGDVLLSSPEYIQTLSSITVCSSTLVTLLKARSLSELPKLVKSLIALLSLVNLHSQSTIDMKTRKNQSDKVLQLSLLRSLIAVVETLPQFMVSYLKPLLTPSGSLCMTLRQNANDDDLAVKSMAERLDSTIAILCPSRQLIPILCTALTNCFNERTEGRDNCNEGATIFSILKAAIRNSSRPDLGPVAGKIVNALIQTYGYDFDGLTNFKLLVTANGTLVALVLKLSEIQLRQLYAKFRQWVATPDTLPASKVSALRRHSFYSLSAAMSKELRSIFLPCVSSVVGDIAKELEHAASHMCAISKQTEHNKRRKLNENSTKYDYHEVRPLQPLLLFLETALKADAYEGGNWIRSDDNERYRMLVGPLGKLLQARVPSESIDILDFEIPGKGKRASAYERLVQGVGTKDYGNVISCITSLAAAAGNEQLWKPLNHLLLEACGNERRPEVRKSGVKALLSIIQSLGEEYMVLLPECLPVLSELLEDDEDEEIVALAKECIRQGEALLGESLEESLR